MIIHIKFSELPLLQEENVDLKGLVLFVGIISYMSV